MHEEAFKFAIKESLKLWKYLAETGSRNKLDWAGWENKIWDDGCINDCPVCWYTQEYVDRGDCLGCIFADEFDGYCGNEGSPYAKWLDANTKEERVKAAHEMVHFLEQYDE